MEEEEEEEEEEKQEEEKQEEEEKEEEEEEEEERRRRKRKKRKKRGGGGRERRGRRGGGRGDSFLLVPPSPLLLSHLFVVVAVVYLLQYGKTSSLIEIINLFPPASFPPSRQIPSCPVGTGCGLQSVSQPLSQSVNFGAPEAEQDRVSLSTAQHATSRIRFLSFPQKKEPLVTGNLLLVTGN